MLPPNEHEETIDIADGVDTIADLPQNKHEETINIADNVDTIADLPGESARIPGHSPRVCRLLHARRRRNFPIRLWPVFVNALVKFLIWHDHYRLYEVHMPLTMDEVQARYRLNSETMQWRKKEYALDMRRKLQSPILLVFYFTDTHWTLVYQNKLRKEEKRQRRRFMFD